MINAMKQDNQSTVCIHRFDICNPQTHFIQVPFYIRELSICRLWYPQVVLELPPMDTEGQWWYDSIWGRAD